MSFRKEKNGMAKAIPEFSAVLVGHAHLHSPEFDEGGRDIPASLTS
jgi:hypothetical protein